VPWTRWGNLPPVPCAIYDNNKVSLLIAVVELYWTASNIGNSNKNFDTLYIDNRC
jgi:hypothetical protein